MWNTRTSFDVATECLRWCGTVAFGLALTAASGRADLIGSRGCEVGNEAVLGNNSE